MILTLYSFTIWKILQIQNNIMFIFYSSQEFNLKEYYCFKISKHIICTYNIFKFVCKSLVLWKGRGIVAVRREKEESILFLLE